MGQPIQHLHNTHTQPNGQGTQPQPVIFDDDDWEYEYDGTATEDYYLTLDLTTHVSDALVQKGERQTARKIFDAYRSTTRRTEEDDEPAADKAEDDEEPPPPAGKLQILDLHTINPLVKFDNRVYSCHWGTDLGTQFHITKSGHVPAPYRAGTLLDVVGTTRTRLFGKPADLRDRNAPRLDTIKPVSRKLAAQLQPENEDDSDYEQEEEEEEEQKDFPSALGWQVEPGKPLKIPRGNYPTQSFDAQASFLERLSEIKLQRGELDQVKFQSMKMHNTPTPGNKDELRKAALDLDARREKEKKKGPEPRGQKRRRPTHAEMGIEEPTPTGSGRQSRESVAARLGFREIMPGPSTPQPSFTGIAVTPTVTVEDADMEETQSPLHLDEQNGTGAEDGGQAGSQND